MTRYRFPTREPPSCPSFRDGHWKTGSHVFEQLFLTGRPFAQP